MYKFFLVGLVIIIVFLKIDKNIDSVEKKIYNHTTKSLVLDLDLNVINQVPERDRWLVTSTYNYPDIHHNGVVAFWLPAFAYTFVITKILNPINTDKLWLMAEILMTFLFGLATLIMTYRIARQFTDKTISILAILIATLTTPFGWMWLFKTQNVDITASFWVTIFIGHYLSFYSRPNPKSFFIWGIVWSIGFAIKIDFLFLICFWLHPLLFIKESFNSKIKYLFYWALGASPVWICITINEFIKTGISSYGYADTINFKLFLLKDMLWAHSGSFIVHPILLLIFLWPLIYFLRPSKLNRLNLILILAPIVKTIGESFTYVHSEGLGNRHYTSDFVIFVLVLISLLIFIKKMSLTKNRSYFLGGSACLFVTILALHHFFLGFCITKNFPTFFYHGACYNYYFSDMHNIDQIWTYWTDLLSGAFSWGTIEYLYLPPLLVFMGLGALLIKSHFSYGKIAAVIATIYIAITGLNLHYNKTNASILKEQGFFDQSAVSVGPHAHYLFENVGTMQRSIQYYQINGTHEDVVQRINLMRDYLTMAMREIVVDPLNIKVKFMNNIEKPIPDDFWAEN